MEPAHSLPCKISCSNCHSLIMDEGRHVLLLYPELIKHDSGPDRQKLKEIFYPKSHMFYSQRVVDIPDGKPKWIGINGSTSRRPAFMTSWSQTTSNRASWLHIFLILIFILAFFPDLFITVPYFVYQLLSSSSQPPAPPKPQLPPCSTICTPAIPTMSWFQKRITLPSRSRGSYLVTDHIVSQIPEISSYKTGILHLFVQHTSCALSLNENYDSDVREDMSDALDRIAPEDHKGALYRHSAEGPDDMPAHVKSSLIGASVTIPITNGRLATGMWQGIWYLEFRTSKHTRNVVATIQGEKA
ncbi:TPA_exp: hypothetical protein A8136_1792 [Trichophyton benhamiae CBS 112371]|nr:TPA_exp: hypothetical protein A8136_1792 [Trichophyton benhamiae CBS 112371]